MYAYWDKDNCFGAIREKNRRKKERETEKKHTFGMLMDMRTMNNANDRFGFKLIKQHCASVLNLLLPRLCPVCGKRLMPSEDAMCIGCMSTLPIANMENSRDNMMIRIIWPGVAVEHGLCLFYYRSYNEHQRTLMQFKYMKNAGLARTMGKLAATALAAHGIEKEIDAIIPVPLSRQRRIERGYNQSEWLAEGIGKAYQRPVNTTLLKRIMHRSLQTHLNREERMKNAEGLYRAEIPEQMRGKHFLLVDDVCTTGATLSACAKAIKEADPSAKVSIFALTWVGE